MNDDITQLLSELQLSLNQLTTAQQSQAEKLPILNQAANSNHLLSTLSALISEGNIHRSETWAAHMSPAISTTSLLGHLIAGLHNGNLLSPQIYPILASIEQQILDWLCNVFQHQHGHFVAGSSYANLEALWQAKQQSNNANVVYASQAAHYSIAKACQILDLKLKPIATDNNDRLLPTALQQACEDQAPLAIVATAGTPTAGAIDPIANCVEISQQFNAWLHIDAAWGGALIILPEHKSLFGELSQANSICFDPHKGWQQPKPASILLYQQPLKAMLDSNVDYLEFTPSNSLPGSRGGELFLPLWLTLMGEGIDALREKIRLRLGQAESFSSQLKQRTDWEIYSSPTGIVCFHINRSVDLTLLVEQGIFSQASILGTNVYRAVFASPNTKATALIAALEPYF
ncbi:MAG: aspartate aminotransferase family protein [Piscirickettsiaceae bacterium]|nr:aspartate aminotransferase family protein [Piscirickettsiaceae bacterium]